MPIYYGARNIGRIFDEEGIIRVDNINDIPKIVDKILFDPQWEYGKRSKAIDYNYERVKEFDRFEQWFFGRYGDELDELYEKMKAANVYGRRYFYPLISEFSTYRGLESARPENLPNARKMANSVICLPMHHELSESDITRIIELIIKKTVI